MEPAVRALASTLMVALVASQAALVVVNPVLPEIAADLDVTVATAGQVRTVSGLVAGSTALATGLLAGRMGLRELLLAGLGLLVAGSALSAAAPDFVVLAISQALVGAGIGIAYSVTIAAVAEWSPTSARSRVLSVVLLGPPVAWIIGMPAVGLLGELSWRLAWVIVPILPAIAAGALLARRPSTPPAERRAGLGTVLRQPGVVRWSTGELLASSGWVGALVFMGALFVESYDLSVVATGFVLGFGALVYLPGNMLFRRWVDEHNRTLLVGLALAAGCAVVLVYAVRPSLPVSIVFFALLSFLAGGRTLAGSARSLQLAPELRLGVTGVRTGALQFGYFLGAALGGGALAAGGYGALGVALGALFVAAALAYVLPPVRAPSAQLP